MRYYKVTCTRVRNIFIPSKRVNKYILLFFFLEEGINQKE